VFHALQHTFPLNSYLGHFTTLPHIRFMLSRRTFSNMMVQSQPTGMREKLIVVYFKYSEMFLESVNYLRKSLVNAAVFLQIFESHASQILYRSGICLVWFLVSDYWISKHAPSVT
jgi:hypothetical protein